tara:strand:+ start:1181 stop:1948 length:768 start_codon:yes stop_codon:yes gene_type:complete
MISKLSCVSKNSKLGKNLSIDAFSIIHENVEIGDNCWIGSNVTILPGARIGNNCKIFPGAVISGDPQDLKFKEENTVTIINDNTIIREFVTINRGTKATKETFIGSNCFIMAYCHIAHDCRIGSNCILANAVNIAGHVTIENDVTIGGMTAIKQFTNIGKHSMISGGSLVRKDIPPYIKVAKEPLKFLGINIVGLKRKKFSEKDIQIIKNIYRIIFKNGKNISDSLCDFQKKELNDKEKNIIDFIKKSKQGIIKN